MNLQQVLFQMQMLDLNGNWKYLDKEESEEFAIECIDRTLKEWVEDVDKQSYDYDFIINLIREFEKIKGELKNE